MNKTLTILIVLTGVMTAAAVEQAGFDRYQVVIDRSPFGVPSAVGGPAGPVPGWADQYTFVGVVPDPASTNVLAIIQDKDRAYLKAVGESIGDVKIKEIEAAGRSSKLVLQRGLEVAPLRFKDQAGGVPPLPQAAGFTLPAAGAVPKPGGNQPTSVPPRRRIPFRRGD